VLNIFLIHKLEYKIEICVCFKLLYILFQT